MLQWKAAAVAAALLLGGCLEDGNRALDRVLDRMLGEAQCETARAIRASVVAAAIRPHANEAEQARLSAVLEQLAALHQARMPAVAIIAKRAEATAVVSEVLVAIAERQGVRLATQATVASRVQTALNAAAVVGIDLSSVWLAVAAANAECPA